MLGVFAFSGLAAGNFVSPGLGKCLDLKAELKKDGKTRESLHDMKHKDGPIAVQLYKCHGNHNQHYEIVDGTFRSYSLPDRCLTVAKAADNENINLEKCVTGNANQQWDLTGDGYIKLKGSNECIDVEAEKKKDGSREVWSEIKAHKVVNVHLYKCHDPEKTDRVNQLWEWAPWQKGQRVTEKTEQKWELRDIGAPGSSNFALGAVAAVSGVGAVIFFVVGAFAGLRFRQTPATPALASMEE